MFCSSTGNWLNPVCCLLVRFPGDFSPFKRPSGAFFSLRCLIYKVHAVPGGTLLLYSTSFRLSSTFFKSFWRPIRFRISSNFLSLPHSRSFVKNFFSEVFGFLLSRHTRQLFYVTTSCGHCQVLFSFPLCRSAHGGDSLVRIPRLPTFVNTFFQFF